MCFAVASSPAQFQHCSMYHTISRLPGVAAYLNNLIITGSSEEEYSNNLNKLLQQIYKYGFCAKYEKCDFFKDSREYLGHIIDKDGKGCLDLFVEAIKLLKRPQNVQELQAFLSKTNYYERLVKNLAENANTLHNL